MSSDVAFSADAWAVLYAAVAGASAALTGLLFVAFSLNLRTITGNPMHMARSREVLATLLILLVLSIAVLVPGQRRELLGIELLIGGLIVLVTSGRNQLRTLSMLEPAARQRWTLRNLLLNAATLAIVIAGLSLLIGRFGGLYWLLPTLVIYFLWAVINAWILVVRVQERARAEG
jgi:modulator of FtsH protease